MSDVPPGGELYGSKHSHVTLSIQPGYVSTLPPFHNSADLKLEKEHDYKCYSCGKILGGNYWVNNETCWVESLKFLEGEQKS